MREKGGGAGDGAATNPNLDHSNPTRLVRSPLPLTLTLTLILILHLVLTAVHPSSLPVLTPLSTPLSRWSFCVVVVGRGVQVRP